MQVPRTSGRAAVKGRLRTVARDDVVSAHLRRVRHRRDDVLRVLDGGRALVAPTDYERAALVHEREDLDVIERGLLAVLPPGWQLSGTARGRFGVRTEQRVLAELRTVAAVALVRLEHAAAPGGEVDETAWDDASTAFEYLDAELLRITTDAQAAWDHRMDPAMGDPRDDDLLVHWMHSIGTWGRVVGTAGPAAARLRRRRR